MKYVLSSLILVKLKRRDSIDLQPMYLMVEKKNHAYLGYRFIQKFPQKMKIRHVPDGKHTEQLEQ